MDQVPELAETTTETPLREADTLTQREQAALEMILATKAVYVPHPLFSESDGERKIFTEAPTINLPDTSWYGSVMDNLPEARPKSAGRVLLTGEEERALFLQFNYCRFRVANLMERAHAEGLSTAAARELMGWFAKSRAYRDQIAEANLALVLAMAKRGRSSGVDFCDLVSEGNMALLRAVDRFDVSRGFKFSTFACRAIIKALTWMSVKAGKYRKHFCTDLEIELDQSDFNRGRRHDHSGHRVEELRRVIKENQASLSQLEQEVLEHRFALGERHDREPGAQPLTLEQVGRLIGVAKGRVRKIQNKALQKIADTLGSDFMS